MEIDLLYGKGNLSLTLPDHLNVTVIESKYDPSIEHVVEALRHALRHPLGTLPLAELAAAHQTVGIVFSDITRPTPNHLILPIILEELAHIPPENITLFNALGTHRPNTDEELIKMLGKSVVDQYRIVQNNAFDPSTQLYLGKSSLGHDQWINRAYMECDVKILTGFIEPHLFAGFSGGGKAVMPGMAGLQTVLGNHDAKMIAHPNAKYGVTLGNPIWEEAREIALRSEPAFLLNVTLNRNKDMTGIFAGELQAAHDAGIAFVRDSAMVSVDEPFDVVITTNSGYPLDMNLYQCGKGMSAAENVTRQGGTIIMVAECSEGLPEHGLYGQMLREASSPQALFDSILHAPENRQDQWAGQIQARIQMKADVYLYSDGLSDGEIIDALLTPCRDLSSTVFDLLNNYGSNARIGILPEGPQTIPYILKPNAISRPP